MAFLCFNPFVAPLDLESEVMNVGALKNAMLRRAISMNVVGFEPCPICRLHGRIRFIDGSTSPWIYTKPQGIQDVASLFARRKIDEKDEIVLRFAIARAKCLAKFADLVIWRYEESERVHKLREQPVREKNPRIPAPLEIQLGFNFT